ncbi:hypothetical protein WICMUC_000569 [Wickerhamomyces mucosus]|uniref:Glutathione hydrolase n=1 Tax=Wickerhamomyces mucosus TaxID=1378264 RepID=A0A9P8TII3_9ASCO|nr:hypothetical protein WICMUC_000569 [Wickerhamomyces mucosus]
MKFLNNNDNIADIEKTIFINDNNIKNRDKSIWIKLNKSIYWLKYIILTVLTILTIWYNYTPLINYNYINSTNHISSHIDDNRGIDIKPLIREPSLDPSPIHLKISLKGAVASDVEECSKLGTDILLQGGFAADAAVTVALCIGAINSFNSGIGGGGFITSKLYQDDNAISIDAREAAPLNSYRDMFIGRENLSKIGGLAACIPGELKGLYTLFETHGSGKLSWKQVIEPVIELTRNGWNASIVLASAIKSDENFLKDNYEIWKFLFKENKTELIEVGDLVKRPILANTLELIANNGSDAIFYDPYGPIASNLIKTINNHGGIFQPDDFILYKPIVSTALHTKFLNNDVYTCQGSCSGPALITGLNIFNSFGIQEGKDMDPLSTHRLIETMKHMASARTRLGDPNTDNINLITSKEYAEIARNLIDDNKTLDSIQDYNPAYQNNEPHGTTHFSIVDQYNNAVSMTSTINLLFGSLVKDPQTGIILNNEMDDFSTPGSKNAFGLQPSIFNFIRPQKRPLSSTVPTIIVNELGKPDLIIGSAGGSRILTAVFQAIVRTYSYNIPLLETLAYPRIHHQLSPNHIEYETHIGNDIIESLKSKGHDVLEQPPKTAMNAIRRWRGEWHAVSDYWRKRGVASAL